MQEPEAFVSRWGMPVATLLMQISLIVVFIWLDFDPARSHPDEHDKPRLSLKLADGATCALGVFALCGFYIVGSVSGILIEYKYRNIIRKIENFMKYFEFFSFFQNTVYFEIIWSFFDNLFRIFKSTYIFLEKFFRGRKYLCS